MKSTPFTRHVYAVQHYVRHTATRYECLMESKVTTHPICCFGNVETAKVVTVGVNPSWSEFEKPRWPEEMDRADLAQRCLTYFDENPNPKPHPWFGPWNEALRHIGCSYKDGSAVHLDLSPRPTRFISHLKERWEQELFLEMVKRDLWIFFATLELCRNAKVLLIAGSVTGKYYVNEFLQRAAPRYGYKFEGCFCRSEHPGPVKTCWHRLSNGRPKFQVFFCSSSPSDRDKQILPARIQQNASKLKRFMNPPKLQHFFNTTPCEHFNDLLAAYPEGEFKSPFRSTVPLLALLRDGSEMMQDILSACGMNAPAQMHSEFKVRPRKGRGKESHTDIMVVSGECSLAVESKWTEPPYSTVRKWLAEEADPTNGPKVLTGWLELLQRHSTKPLKARDFDTATYQMVHRAASACAAGQHPALAYLLFSPQKNGELTESRPYREALKHLHWSLGNPERFPFYLVEVEVEATAAFNQIEGLANGTRETVELVKAALAENRLFSFQGFKVQKI